MKIKTAINYMVLFLFIGIFVTHEALATEKYWTGGGDGTSWSDGNNWNPTGTPQNYDNVYLLYTGSSDVTVIYNSSIWLGSVEIDGTGSGLITLDISNYFLPDTVRVGYSGKGRIIQQSGTHDIRYSLMLGGRTGSTGTYHLSGTGKLIIERWDEIIGNSGTGNFFQSGGTHTVKAGLVIGRYAGSSGVYNLSGNGSLSVLLGECVACNGTGSFLQSGGTHSIGDNLYIGQGSGSSGTYTLQGSGTLVVNGSEFVGYSGAGKFNQTGGTHTVKSELFITYNSSSSGIFNLSGGTLNVNTEIIGAGVFNQSGGTHTVDNNLFVRYGGEYNLSGTGSLTVKNNEFIGERGNGVFNQTAGIHTVNKDLFFGYYGFSNGIYNLSNTGSLIVKRNEYLGYDGVATFNQTGGTHRVDGILNIGSYSGDGTYNLSGGTLTAHSIVNKDTLNYTGGNLNLGTDGSGTYTNIITGVTNLSGAGTRTINGKVTNLGTFNVNNTTANYTGRFTNFGAYISDPSTNYFNDLVISSSGYLSGGAGDSWIISGDLISMSTQNTLWSTADSYLSFVTGADLLHDLYITGKDLGAVLDGFTNNFAWGTLELAENNILRLFDGDTITNVYTSGIVSYDSSRFDGGALYVNRILGLDISGTSILNIYGNGLNIYYLASANDYLGGLTYELIDGGYLIPIKDTAPVPEPGTVVLFTAGLAGFAAFRKRLKK